MENEYYEYLHKNLDILFNGKIGFLKFQPTDIQTKPNRYLEVTRGFKNFHFCINVPYAGKYLNWEVIFDPEDISELPDFDFNDYSFLSEPDINYIAENVPSWDSWNLVNSQCLLNVLNEFLALFKKAQLEKLFKRNKYSDLKKQYEDLLKIIDISEDKVEVFIENKSNTDVGDDESVLVNFLILLPIDFSELPEYYQEDDDLLNPGVDFAYLGIQMKKLDNSQTKVDLSLSPRVDQVLGKVKLPKFRTEVTLAEYAAAVQGTIQEQIKIIVDQHQKRSLFVSAVVESFSSGIVEYDSVRFQKVVFIYEDLEDYDCLVTITLGPKFPRERPRVQLSSLYCQVGRGCHCGMLFAYAPDASVEVTMRALRDAMRAEVRPFQNHKH